MKEKLIIKNFGPIKSAELELGRFTVLIGEQATGKSTVAKLLAVCRDFSYIVELHSSKSDRNYFLNGLIAWGLQDFATSETYISYQNSEYSLLIDKWIKITDEVGLMPKPEGYHRWNLSVKIEPISQRFIALLQEFGRLLGSINDPVEEDIIIWSQKKTFEEIVDNPLYLPAERGLQSLFSLGKDSIQNFSNALFIQFAQIDRIQRSFTENTFVSPLRIFYRNSDGRGVVKKETDSFFSPLFNAATGYQSLIPIFLSTSYYGKTVDKRKLFIIEEPELNLFPSTQRKLMQYLVQSIVEYGNSTLMTTHSPYVLSSLNNMIYAHRLGQENENEVSQILSKEYWLNLEDVSVYMMHPDGTCENIIDYEEGLIKSDRIDGVSGELNREFEALLNLEFSGK